MPAKVISEATVDLLRQIRELERRLSKGADRFISDSGLPNFGIEGEAWATSGGVTYNRADNKRATMRTLWDNLHDELRAARATAERAGLPVTNYAQSWASVPTIAASIAMHYATMPGATYSDAEYLASCLAKVKG